MIGSLLDGKYRVERVLAEGGMGVVVLATHLQLDRRVAIKFLRATARAADGVLERFEREAKLAAQIRSEHVVRVHDVGVIPELGPYMVMEYLEGENLGSLLGRGPLPIDEAVDYVLQACDALAEVHALHIVHRDIKPDNLFLAHRPPHAPIVKVIDFGISKAAPRRGQTGEWTTETLGTPAYMSPEQLDGSLVDVRADIWALGVVLYELVTGRPPFEAADLPSLCTKIVSAPPIPPRQLRPDLPPPLEAAILRCLAKDPDARIGDVLELSRLVAPFGRPARSTDRVGRVALASRPRDPSRSAQTMLVRRKRPTWIPVAVGACVALAIVGGGLATYALRTGPKKPTAAVVPMPVETPVPGAPAPLPSATPAVEPAPVAEPATAASPTEPPSPSTVRPKRASRPSSPAPAADPRAGFGERH